MRAGDRVPTASVRRSFKPNPAETCVDAQMTAPSARILSAQSDLGSGQKISAVSDTETRLDSRASTLGSLTMWLDELDLSGMRQDFRKPEVRQSVTGKNLTVGGKVFRRSLGCRFRRFRQRQKDRFPSRYGSRRDRDARCRGKGVVFPGRRR